METRIKHFNILKLNTSFFNAFYILLISKLVISFLDLQNELNYK